MGRGLGLGMGRGLGLGMGMGLITPLPIYPLSVCILGHQHEHWGVNKQI